MSSRFYPVQVERPLGWVQETPYAREEQGDWVFWKRSMSELTSKPFVAIRIFKRHDGRWQVGTRISTALDCGTMYMHGTLSAVKAQAEEQLRAYEAQWRLGVEFPEWEL